MCAKPYPEYPCFQPMLSGKFKYPDSEIQHLNSYPYITSPKVDGIRASIGQDGLPYTRTLKLIPNTFIQRRIQYLTRFQPNLKYLDGELVLGGYSQLTQPNIFSDTSSAVMSHGGEPNLTFWVFDSFENPNESYQKRFLNRYDALQQMCYDLNNNPHFIEDPHHKIHFQMLPYKKVNSLAELEADEQLAVEYGFEGLMFRNPDRPYKFGRSAPTKTQQHLMKLTRWETSEAIIEDTEELEHNDNIATTDARGYTKRSSAQANKRGAETLGKFVVRILNGPFAGKSCAVGTGEGLTQELRQRLWSNRELLKGKIITFKYKAHGSKDLPRIPIYKGFRDPIDF